MKVLSGITRLIHTQGNSQMRIIYRLRGAILGTTIACNFTTGTLLVAQESDFAVPTTVSAFDHGDDPRLHQPFADPLNVMVQVSHVVGDDELQRASCEWRDRARSAELRVGNVLDDLCQMSVIQRP